MNNINNIIYLIIFLMGFVIFLKILFESNLHQIFKKGRISEIRIAYVLISIILSFLFASAITKFIDVVYNIIFVK